MKSILSFNLTLMLLACLVHAPDARAEEGYSALFIWKRGKNKTEKWKLQAAPGKVRLESFDKKKAYLFVEGQGTTYLQIPEKRARSSRLPFPIMALNNINADIIQSGNPCWKGGGECKQAGKRKKFGRLCERWIQLSTDIEGKVKGKDIYLVDEKLRVIVYRRLVDGSRLELRRFKTGDQPAEAFVVPEDFAR